ncbi:MbeD/MobD family mobilization/exclusion protein [Pantoea stewartii]|uniref:MbeD/MobD family mobilization/exclusion protein n=1 Tax=Pantoea stewartii TaxID=66269 RepID=UPI003DA6E275
MTELEKQLQSALERLYNGTTRKGWTVENAFAEWRTMSGVLCNGRTRRSERDHGRAGTCRV